MNLDKLKGHVPEAVLAQIPDTMSKFQINTPLRLAHFLAQCGHESGGFKVVNENLNYGAKGLLTTFKKYFPDEATAKLYDAKKMVNDINRLDYVYAYNIRYNDFYSCRYCCRARMERIIITIIRCIYWFLW